MLMREKLKTRQHTGERKAEVKKAREAARVTLQSSSVWWSRVPLESSVQSRLRSSDVHR